MESNENNSLVDQLFEWWGNLGPAGKIIGSGLLVIWLVFIGWVATVQEAQDPLLDDQEVYLPAVADSGQDESQGDGRATTNDDIQNPTTIDEQNAELLDRATRFEINPAQSVASYSAVETFFGDSGLIVGRNTNQGLNTAVGETRGLSGTFYLDLEKRSPKIIAGEFSADLQSLVSVQPHRDDMLKRFWLESNKFPTATFVVTDIPTLPPAYKEGTPAAFPLTGILTVRDIEKEVTFDVVATLEQGTLKATAVTNLLFEDFGITPPNMAGVLQVEPGFKIIVAISAEDQPEN